MDQTRKPSVTLNLAMSQKRNFYVVDSEGKAFTDPNGNLLMMNPRDNNTLVEVAMLFAEKKRALDAETNSSPSDPSVEADPDFNL